MDTSTQEPDRTGSAAVDELRDDPQSRKRFLKMVGGAGAVGALSILIAACGGDDDESDGDQSSSPPAADTSANNSDLEIVNYALTLEYLEADFYDQVIQSGEVTDKKIAELAKSILEHEQAHVEALISTAKSLDGKPAEKPKTNFGDVISGGPEKILETAASVENLGAAAYLGQAASIKSMDILAAALAIHTVEARHAAALNTLVGKTIVPDGAFAQPASMDEVLEQVQPFLAS